MILITIAAIAALTAMVDMVVRHFSDTADTWASEAVDSDDRTTMQVTYVTARNIAHVITAAAALSAAVTVSAWMLKILIPVVVIGYLYQMVRGSLQGSTTCTAL